MLYTNLRSMKQLQHHSRKLMALHDKCADLKSYFDGHGTADDAFLDSTSIA